MKLKTIIMLPNCNNCKIVVKLGIRIQKSRFHFLIKLWNRHGNHFKKKYKMIYKKRHSSYKNNKYLKKAKK